MKKVMVDARANDGEGVVLVCKREEGFALNICIGDVDTVKDRRVVVHYAEKVVIVTEEVGFGLGWRRQGRGRVGVVREGEVRDGAKEGVRGGRGGLSMSRGAGGGRIR